jgi:hypothetical protein
MMVVVKSGAADLGGESLEADGAWLRSTRRARTASAQSAVVR